MIQDMGDIIGQLLAPAIGVALSPLPIVGVILMLLSPKARINGSAFVIGWLVGMALVIGLVLIFVNPSKLINSDDTPSTISGLLHLALGVLLWFLALKQWKNRPKKGEEAKMPKWMAGIDKVTPVVAFGLGAFLSGLNPKNLIFDIAAAATIAAGSLGTGQQIVAALVFMIIASLTVAVPVIWFLAAGEKAAASLDSVRAWLVRENTVIMAVLFLVLGASLVGKALPAFFN